MPSLADLNHRYGATRSNLITPSSETESIICDFRSNITPSQAVERKLRSALIQRIGGATHNGTTVSRKPR
jgi:hypothetical protein